MTLIHFVPHISADAAGLSHSVPCLCRASAARGQELTSSCLAAERNVPDVPIEELPSLLVEALDKLLPRSIIDPRKTGIGIPAGKWPGTRDGDMNDLEPRGWERQLVTVHAGALA